MEIYINVMTVLAAVVLFFVFLKRFTDYPVKHFRLLLLLVSFQAFSQTLSPQARVSLLTISPGDELYSTFGHSAIRITDPVQFIDINYNYGTFDFDSPGFYMKFLRGYLNYIISSHNSYVEMEYWNRSNRLITEQVLNLSPGQKQRMFDYLQNNLRPENRTYRYKFFTDNCSTRLRDVLQAACGDSLVFDHGLNTDSTYRQWIDKYAHENGLKWADFGMDLAIGRGSDQKTGWSDAMFIPDNLMKALDAAQIRTPSGTEKLVLLKHNLNQVQPKAGKGAGGGPAVVFGALFLLTAALTAFQWVKRRTDLRFDRVFFSVLGLAGWILFLLWFCTDHGVTRYNLNILWASPLAFPAVLYLGKKKWASVLMTLYLYGFALYCGHVIFGLFFSGWSTLNGLLFLLLTIAVRLIYLYKNKYIGFRKG